MSNYNPKKIEAKWRKKWEESRLYHTDLIQTKNKFYNLAMFIYPSGDKLHIGHAYNYSGSDAFGRFQRMCGKNVFEPMGYDAFGLPAENYAIKAGIHPAKSTAQNIEFIRKQLKELGCMYDFEREIDTSSPEYYKWTQWLFLTLYKAGLVRRKKAPVNWCPSCKTVLANEQVVNGLCERCGTQVVQKNLKQWFFEITKYADRLLADLDGLDWPQKTVLMQKNWIGRSSGVEIDFSVDRIDEKIKVFTTRPDTLFGATYLVLAPEHDLVEKITTEEQKEKVKKYLIETQNKTELERTSLEKKKTGVFTGAYAINPANSKKIPIWISDYVVLTYGTGAIMAVPAHDQRDFEFAKKFDLPIVEVISSDSKEHDSLEEAYIGEGTMINSGEFNGKKSKEATKKITEWLKSKGAGGTKIQYKLRDWLISRQRYWGAPIPIIFCDNCGEVPVPEKDLPVKLPKIVDYKPTETGESPLARSSEFVKVTCPKCDGQAKRSTETMDTFVCSSWYYLRFLSPDLDGEPFGKEIVKNWCPVDQYTGGAEHAVMHLLYARFIAKVLFDQKIISFDEPFTKLNHQGIILASDGTKMSKSKGNVVIPDEYFKKYGVDTFRLYILFLAPFEEGGSWQDKGILGTFRFLKKVWSLADKIDETKSSQDDQIITHQTIKKVTEDISNFHFNTAISSLMELTNFFSKKGNISQGNLETLIQLLSPLAPYTCEELWSFLGHKDSIFNSIWPKFDQAQIAQQNVTIVIQVNGKYRGQVSVAAGLKQEDIEAKAKAEPNVAKYLINPPKKVIYVPDRLINFVI